MVFLKRNLQSNNRLQWTTCHWMCKQFILLIFYVSLTFMMKHRVVRAQSPTLAPVDGDVRLNGGRNLLEGRVEVYYNGEWGTICDDDWGIQDADVVCRQLGYNMAARLGCCLSFGPGFGPIHLDNLACRGDEESIRDCRFSGWGRHNCGHWEDAGVVCASPIRLMDGVTALDGRVEVYMNGNWGTICNTDWGIMDSLVVCRMLGGYTANEYTQTVVTGEGAVHLDRVQCNGTEASLEQCRKLYVHDVNSDCFNDHNRDVGVNCSRHIRLVNGSNPLEGRLEVFHNDQWGTVCDDGFSASEAEVICRHLGNYVTDPSRSYSCCARFGVGKGSILMSNIMCSGNEKQIEDCSFQGVNQNCQHTEDVSVHCSDLRLVDHQNDLQGKLEYIENHQWGEICSNDWDIRDANVACRQLFNTNAITTYFRDSRTNVQPLFGGFQCNGTEARLSACPRSSYSTCDRYVAGIKCEELIKVRLQAGPHEMEGRVEIFYDNQWGTVCDDGWSIEEAAVVCRQLGNYDVRSAKCCGEYPGGKGQIVLDDVYCHGNERRLEECSHSQWGENNCGHHEDAGVICSDLRIPSASNQATSSIGPIKLLINGTWGNICAEDMTLALANVTCRQVHNTSVISIRSYESLAVPRIDYLQCSGQESMIANCTRGSWVNTSCPSGHIGGVSCHAANKVRLVGGSTPLEGRVELNHDGVWGTICDDSFGAPEANVICRQLGFVGADPDTCCQKFGQGNGQILLDDLSCVGTETSIEECGHRGWASHNCGHHEDAGVICRSNFIPGDVETSGEPPVMPSTIRLVGGSSVLSGRVEVMKDGKFGTVCDDEFGLEEATVVCRQLGFAAADPSACCTSFGGGDSEVPILLDSLQCSGDEDDLFQCEHSDTHNCDHYEDAGVNCLVEAPSPLPGIPSEGDVRLFDGNEFEGRVEIFLGGQWGTVCDDRFDIKDADVICRQLGYKSANPDQCCSYFGAGVGKILLDDLECEGTEANILDCPHTNGNRHNCGHFEDVGIKCIRSVRLNSTSPFKGKLELRHEGNWIAVCGETFTSKEGEVGCLHAGGLEFEDFEQRASDKPMMHVTNLSCTGKESALDNCNISFVNAACQEVYLTCRKRSGPPLRLVDGKHPLEGRVEVFYKGQWGTVCDDGWGESEAVVACRQLGNYVPAMFQNPARCCGAFGIGTLPILLDNVVCNGAEQSLGQCTHGGWNVNNCGHTEDAGLLCTDIRLVGGVSRSVLEGRVEVLINKKWLNISSHNWTKENAAVVCRQLFNATVSSITEYQQMETSSMLTNVRCSGDEEMLTSCQYSSTNNVPKGAMTVSIACSEMRLSDGSKDNEGRIELMSASGEWSSVCSHGFTQQSANVACRQAGFCYASDVYHDRFGPAPDNIRWSGLKCVGNENRLLDCPYRQGGGRCMNSYFIAGVRCKDTCDYPGSLENGEVTPTLNSYENGSIVSLKCKLGYKLNGPSSIVCENCSWRSTMPVCEMSVIRCQDPQKFPNAKIISLDSNPSIAHYGCLDGYHSNEVATYMVCESGTWSGPGIACQEDVAENNDGNDAGFVSSQQPTVNESHSLMWLMVSLLLVILILLVLYDIRKRAYRMHCKPVRFNCAEHKDNEGELQLLSHDVVNQQHESALQEPDTTEHSWPA